MDGAQPQASPTLEPVNQQETYSSTPHLHGFKAEGYSVNIWDKEFESSLGLMSQKLLLRSMTDWVRMLSFRVRCGRVETMGVLVTGKNQHMQ